MIGLASGSRRSLAWYVLAGGLCLLAEVLLFRLWEADFRVPFYYTIGSDVYQVLMAFKSIVEMGWYLVNPRIGAPGVNETYDFPFNGYLHFVIIKLIAAATPDFGMTINLFYLLSFLLITWTSLYVMLYLRISGLVAVVASLLYAFAPYHFMRGQMHMWLAAYYAIPLMALVIIRLCEGVPLFAGGGHPGGLRPRRSWGGAAFAVVACGLTAASDVYTTFFSLFLAAVATFAGFSRDGRAARLVDGLLVMGLLVGLTLVELTPNLWYIARHGRNSAVAVREPWEANAYALSIEVMLRPTPYHQIKALARLLIGKKSSDSASDLHELLRNETRFSALGAFGVCGFLALLAVLFLGRRPAAGLGLLIPLSKLNIAAILLAVPYGLGPLIASLGLMSIIRSYNRISIFIAYFAALAAGLLLDYARRRMTTPGRRLLFDTALVVGLALGLFDQMPRILVPNHAAQAAEFTRDRAFFRRIEGELPDRAMIFQLPYVPYPDDYSRARRVPWSYIGYELFRGYFHTERVRWSYGAMKGREVDRWQARIASEPVEWMVPELIRAGFAGIFVDRAGYDDASGVVASLRRALRVEPVESEDRRFLFFRLPATAERTNLGPAGAPAAVDPMVGRKT